MAEIKIRKKRPVWPWILLVLIVIAALVYFLFFTGENDNDDAEYDNSPTSEQIDNGEGATTNEGAMDTNSWDSTQTSGNQYQDSLTTYSTVFSGDIKSGADVDIKPENVNRALINLIDAVRTKALQKNVQLSNDLKQEREKAVSRSQSAQDTTSQAGFVKNTGTSIVSALQNIQKKEYSNLSDEVSNLQNSVQKIDASKSINNQNHTINQFFDRAVNLLSKMNQ
ncbi:MAG: hypothetical protein WCD31_03455 [Gillisia sp.]